MKKLLFAFMAVTLFACSGDDSTPVDPNNENPQNPNPVTCNKTYNGNIILSTQAEVDAFAANGYCTIKGNIDIGLRVESVGEGEDFEHIVIESDITSLAGLSTIIKIEGVFTIKENPLLTSLNGLNNIESINGGLYIIGNDKITDMTGLSSLSILGKNNYNSNLTISSNRALTSLQGLEHIEEVNNLFVDYNNLLQNLNGLSGLKIVNEIFGLTNNLSVTSFQGLGNLQYVRSFVLSGAYFYNFQGMDNLKEIGSLSMNSCSNVVSLEGLEGLKAMASLQIIGCDALLSCNGIQNVNTLGNLIISGNDSLATLSHFSGLLSLTPSPYYNENKFNVSNNDALQSLEGFENITMFKAEMSVFMNDQLKDFCSLTSLLNEGVLTKPAYIANNLYNPSVQDIINGNCSQ